MSRVKTGFSMRFGAIKLPSGHTARIAAVGPIPIARVAFSMAGFALERDRTYVLLTNIVLSILIYRLAAPH